MDGINFFHQVAKYRALSAAGGDGALLHFGVEVFQPLARGDGDGVGVPIDLYFGDFFDGAHQPLVAQIAECEGFRRLPQRHQGDDFALVDVKRQRMFAGNRRGHAFAVLIDGFDFGGEGAGGGGDARDHGLTSEG